MSPSPEAAAVAVNIYLKPDDPPRLVVPLMVSDANILDFRTPETEEMLGLKWRETAVPWAEQRTAGSPATSWRASDAARAAGADGMIYPPNAPTLSRDGPASAFNPDQ